MHITPYLFFEGRCEEAASFYAKAIDAKVVSAMKYKESPEPMPPGMLPPGSESKIMHMEMHVGDNKIMASDGMCSGKAAFNGVSLTINASSAEEAQRYFSALGEGGTVQMPLAATFYAKSFGMLRDKFGLSWMVIALI